MATNDVLSGAAQGAAAGSAVFPGVGTAIGAGVGAITGYLGGKAKKKAEKREKERQRQIAYLSSPEYLLSVLAKIHPAFRAQVAATFGPQVQQALDKQAALLGPSGAGAALTSAAALAPDVAAYGMALDSAEAIQARALGARVDTPSVAPTLSPWLGAVQGGALGYESAAAAARARKEAELTNEVNAARNSTATPDTSPISWAPTSWKNPVGEPPLLPSAMPGMPGSTSPLAYRYM